MARIIPCDRCSMTGWYKNEIDKNVWQKCEVCCQHLKGFKRKPEFGNKWLCIEDCGYFKVPTKFYLGDEILPEHLQI